MIYRIKRLSKVLGLKECGLSQISINSMFSEEQHPILSLEKLSLDPQAVVSSWPPFMAAEIQRMIYFWPIRIFYHPAGLICRQVCHQIQLEWFLELSPKRYRWGAMGSYHMERDTKSAEMTENPKMDSTRFLNYATPEGHTWIFLFVKPTKCPFSTT